MKASLAPKAVKNWLISFRRFHWTPPFKLGWVEKLHADADKDWLFWVPDGCDVNLASVFN